MKRTKLALLLASGIAGVGSIAVAASAAVDGHQDPPEVPVATTPMTMPTGPMDIMGTDSQGNPITVHVDSLEDWQARAQAVSDELRADEPYGVYYTFVTDEFGNPKPYQRCVMGGASENVKQSMRDAGMTAEAVAQLADCQLVD